MAATILGELGFIDTNVASDCGAFLKVWAQLTRSDEDDNLDESEAENHEDNTEIKAQSLINFMHAIQNYGV